MSRTFFLCANIINSLFSGYFILSDTEELLFSIDNTDYYNEKIKRRKFRPKDKISEKKISFKKNISIDEKRNSLQITSHNRNINKNEEDNNKIMFSSLDNINKEKEKTESEIKKIDFKERKQSKEILYKEKNVINFDNKKRSFNWLQFIWFKIRRKNPIIYYYKDYRTKVISEENFIRSQLDIYELEKICKI